MNTLIIIALFAIVTFGVIVCVKCFCDTWLLTTKNQDKISEKHLDFEIMKYKNTEARMKGH